METALLVVAFAMFNFTVAMGVAYVFFRRGKK